MLVKDIDEDPDLVTVLDGVGELVIEYEGVPVLVTDIDEDPVLVTVFDGVEELVTEYEGVPVLVTDVDGDPVLVLVIDDIIIGFIRTNQFFQLFRTKSDTSPHLLTLLPNLVYS